MKIYTEPKKDTDEESFRVFVQDQEVVLLYEDENLADQWNLTSKEAYQLAIALRDSAMILLGHQTAENQEKNPDCQVLRNLVDFLKDVQKDLENSSK
jgi:hypothetical protein